MIGIIIVLATIVLLFTGGFILRKQQKEAAKSLETWNPEDL